MAPKRKALAPPPPPPPAAQSSSSDDDSSSSSDEEQQAAAQPTSSRAKTVKPGSDSGSDSGDDSSSSSDDDPQTKTQNDAPKKPSESESSEEGDEEEAVPSESEKRPKLSQDEGPSKKSSSSAIQRIWSEADEIAVLGALSQYLAKNGRLPPQKEYASFLSTVSGSIGFPASDRQLLSKVRSLRWGYVQKRKKGSAAKFSSSHERTVFEMSKTVFEASCKKAAAAAKEVPKKEEPSYFNLRNLIKDMIRAQKFPWSLLTVDDVLARIGESEAHDLNAKAKILGTDALKLSAREDNLQAELLSVIANDMADD